MYRQPAPLCGASQTHALRAWLISMSRDLKFAEVVKHARLDADRAQYALKHPEYLEKMPIAGSQGLHRTFTWRQAVRLAICTHLVSARNSAEEGRSGAAIHRSANHEDNGA